jgi:DNA polymerase-1
VVNQSLNQAGLRRERAVVLNAVNCYDQKHLTDGEYNEAVACCRPAVEKVVGKLPVIAMGNKALLSLTRKSNVFQWMGAPLGNVFPVFHPASCFRKPSLLPIFSMLMRRAGQWLRGNYVPYKWPAIYIEPNFQALQALSRIRGADLIGVDVETAGEPLFADLLCVGVASQEEAVSLRWPIKEPYLSAMKKVLTAPGTKLFHNKQHDQLALEANGLPLEGRTDDTLVIHAAMAPQIPHSLSFVSMCELPVDRWKSEFHDESEFKGLEVFTNSSAESLRQYNARDCGVEPPLWKKLAPRATAQHQALYDNLMDLSEIATAMRKRGVLVDDTARNVHRESKSAEMDKLAEMFRTIGQGAELGKTGTHGSLKKLFFDELKAPVLRTTESGKPALDSWVLSQYKKYPTLTSAATVLLDYRKAAKLKTTYLDNLPVLPDGRVHPAWSVWRVITGRWACGAPNMMNIPKKLRDMFIPTPGHTFVAADWQKVELWIVAILAGDEPLLQAFHDGVDVHTLNASDLYGVPASQIGNPSTERDFAKRFVYGANYGASAETLWESSVVEFPDLRLNHVVQLRKRWFEAHPAIKAWQTRTIAQAEDTGRVSVPLEGGRVQIFHDRHEQGLANKAINFGVQGIVGWMANRAIQEVRELNPVLQVHDELVLEPPLDQAETYAKALKIAMERPVNLHGQDWSFPVDLSVGKNWGSMESFECD